MAVVSRVFWLWYSVGAVLLVFMKVPEGLKFSNGLFLVLYGAYALSLLHQAENRLDYPVAWRQRTGYIVLAATIIWLGGMAVEWIGVNSGLLFGSYSYSDVLGPLVMGVPVTLGFAWIAVVVNAFLISGNNDSVRGRGSRIMRAARTGAWAVLLDLVLDPVAQHSGYWYWSSAGGFYGVPWSNFLCWFLIGALLSLILPHKPLGPVWMRKGKILYQMILLLFGLVALRYGLWLCPIIAAAGILLAERSCRHVKG
ncbi:carotenoid biosynthesis protein [Paenibacillus sp. YPG26]|uniref:carotenoid biosynthesis protein n=1 Tax=Paenibacillus sp. YPG26 TaxID=2878915 RepID=UPI00203A6A0A|nr:carotenoid biosynthesis protein [Paenibacillus sp. YPG26]USB32905.1 carotenoid biosynthesis protein [Paenibacillus sp. YPG26]